MQTYDDSGWTMGYAFDVDVKAVNDKAILDVTAPLVKEVVLKGTVAGTATAGLAVAHFGSNNMITFRYRLKNVPMRIAEKDFTIDGKAFPAGSFIITGGDLTAVRAAEPVHEERQVQVPGDVRRVAGHDRRIRPAGRRGVQSVPARRRHAHR